MKTQLGKFGTLFIDNGCCEHEQLVEISGEVFAKIAILKKSYPKLREWYFKKVVPGLFDGTRTFILELRDGQIAGVAILKDTVNEKKICTISVEDAFKSKGMGFRLFEKSMLLLKSDKPLASVSEDRVQDFEKIFQYFDYEFTSEYKGLYLPQKSEYSFNGVLCNENKYKLIN
jgi:hypothetical protein